MTSEVSEPVAQARPPIRLGHLMELVLILAVGIALARDQLNENQSRLALRIPGDWVRILGGAWLSGVALAGGLGLLVETLRARKPSTWGIGRWIWSIAALKTVLSSVVEIAIFLVPKYRPKNPFPLMPQVFERLRGLISIALGNDFAIGLVAICLTAYVSQKLSDPRPDAREWAGRVFGSLIIAVAIAVRVLYLYQR